MKRGWLAPGEKVNMVAPEEARGKEIEGLLDPSHPSKGLLP